MVRDIFTRYGFLVREWQVANVRRSTVPPLMIILTEVTVMLWVVSDSAVDPTAAGDYGSIVEPP